MFSNSLHIRWSETYLIGNVVLKVSGISFIAQVWLIRSHLKVQIFDKCCWRQSLCRDSTTGHLRSQSSDLSHGCALISAAPSSPSPTLDPSLPVMGMKSTFNSLELPRRSSGSHSNFVRKSAQSLDSLGCVGNRSVCFHFRLDKVAVSLPRRRDLGHLHLLSCQVPLEGSEISATNGNHEEKTYRIADEWRIPVEAFESYHKHDNVLLSDLTRRDTRWPTNNAQ